MTVRSLVLFEFFRGRFGSMVVLSFTMTLKNQQKKNKTRFYYVLRRKRQTAATLTGDCRNESSWSA